ncbi:MAG: hybrid sensor histidine kinase/response regulator [Promethearchaeota archaeon]
MKISEIDEKMQKSLLAESLGLLAGGIAHDFNNIFTSILGNIQLSKLSLEEKETPNDDEIFDFLTEAEAGIDRAKNLTSQLLIFSKDRTPMQEITEISKLLRKTVNFTLSGSNVSCNFIIDKNLWHVNVDQKQINRVLYNIILNAIQSMPIGGIIKLSAENITIDVTKNKSKNYDFIIDAGKYVKITIHDSGIGIPEEDLPNIFQPLYKGKNKTVGNGMGLTNALSIIKQHNGYIDLISEEKEEESGTSVFIYIPAVVIDENITKEVKTEDKFHYGQEMILIMDDEKRIRKVLSRMVNQLGYKPYSVNDGNNAIELCRKFYEKGTPFNGAILDLTIKGGKGGKETVEELHKIDPRIKLIASSGYTIDPVIKNFHKYGFSAILIKPYKLKELDQVLFNLFNN